MDATTSINSKCTIFPAFRGRAFFLPHQISVVLPGSGGGGGIRSAVLALKTDGLVDEQVSCDRVASSRNGEGNDNTFALVSLCNPKYVLPIVTNREATAQRGSS